ncbi:MAG: hypothetical protein LBL83_04415, partial [Clostridiales bacterium]|nr:hypothetical protein [Clostridiales bacterium]
APQAEPLSIAAEAEAVAGAEAAAETVAEAAAQEAPAQEAETVEAVAQEEAAEQGEAAREAAPTEAAAPEAAQQGTGAPEAAAQEEVAEQAVAAQETGAAEAAALEVAQQGAETPEVAGQGAVAPEAGAQEGVAAVEAVAPEAAATATAPATVAATAPVAMDAYGAEPSAPDAWNSPGAQAAQIPQATLAAQDAPSAVWLPAVPSSASAGGVEAAYEPLANPAFDIKDLTSRLRAAIEALVKLPSELPAERRKISAGVFELAGDKEYVIERTMAPATADYVFMGEGFRDVGSFTAHLSFKTEDVAGCTVSLPESLASDAYILTDLAAPLMPGYTTYAIDVRASGKSFSVGDGEAVLNVSLTLSGKTTRSVSLVLSRFEAVYYDEAFDGGKYDIDADALIARSVATTRVRFASRFDANRDGIVDLRDVDRTRQHMGSMLGENGWEPRPEAWSCDIGGGLGNAPDGIVNIVDLTLAIAAYEATVK